LPSRELAAALVAAAAAAAVAAGAGEFPRSIIHTFTLNALLSSTLLDSSIHQWLHHWRYHQKVDQQGTTAAAWLSSPVVRTVFLSRKAGTRFNEQLLLGLA